VSAAGQQFGYTQIVAPYDGVVTQRLVEAGETVSPGQPLAGVAALGALRVVVDLPQSEAVKVRALGRGTVYVGDHAVPSARVTVYPAATSGSNTVRVRVDLPAGVQDLYPGMFAKVGFALGGAERLAVPAASVVRRSEVTAVYTVATDGSISFRQVRLGRTAGDRVEVLAGLHAGDRVALDPLEAARRLKAR
jgi:RND family efflux transporter MFP subunit